MPPALDLELHVAIVSHDDGTHVLTGATDEEMYQQLHAFVRSHRRDDLPTREEPEDPLQAIDAYFDHAPVEYLLSCMPDPCAELRRALLATAHRLQEWTTRVDDPSLPSEMETVAEELVQAARIQAPPAVREPYRFEVAACPACANAPAEILERQDGWAELVEEDEGGFGYGGSTDRDEFSQEPIWRVDGFVLRCERGHQWRSQALGEPAEPVSPT